MFHGFFSQDFSLSRPRLEPRHLPGTFHLGVFLHHPTEPSTLQRTEFFRGEDLVKFHHIFWGEANQIFLGRVFWPAFWTANFWHGNRFLAQKSYLHIAWRHGRHTKALCQNEDDAYGSIRMIFAFMFFGSHTCFERLHFNRSACHITESTTWPVCCFWGTPGGHLGAKLVLPKTNLGSLPLFFAQNLRTKHMFHLWCLMSLTKLAAQKSVPGVSEGAE